MATSSDLQLRLSGGASNSNPLLAIGGAMSNSSAPANLFDDILVSELAAGGTEYRCIYLFNSSADTLKFNRIYFTLNSPSPDTDIAIGLGAAGLNGDEAATANTTAVPSSVTFSSPISASTGLAIPTIEAGDYFPVWVRRVTLPNAVANPNDGFSLRWSAQVVPSGSIVETEGYFGGGYFSNYLYI